MRYNLKRARRLTAIVRGETFERVDASGRIRKISRAPTGSERTAALLRLEEELERLERELS